MTAAIKAGMAFMAFLPRRTAMSSFAPRRRNPRRRMIIF